MIAKLFSPELKVGDCTFNADRIIDSILSENEQGIDLAVFPELSLTSCSCGDLFRYDALLEGALISLNRVATATSGKKIVAVLGLPFRYDEKIYDCAAVIRNGVIEAIVPKKDGKRRDGISFDFADGKGITTCVELESGKVMFLDDYQFDMKDQSVSIVIGSDIETVELINTTIINPSASIEIAGKENERRERIRRASKASCAVLSVNPSFYESTTDFVFSGYAAVAVGGDIIAEREPFAKGELEVQITPPYRSSDLVLKSELDEKYAEPHPFLSTKDDGRYYEHVLNIQAHGLMKRMLHVGSKKAVFGISGGLDSTLAILVAARAMDLMSRPRTDILAVSMPAFGTSGRTKNNARKVSELLGVDFREIPIGESIKLHFRDIGHSGETADAAFENAQARERTQVLMDLSNMVGGIQIGTGDLSELALGFATYGGDQMSMYGLNGSIPKTLVKALVIYCGDLGEKDLKEVLYDIADTPISPELMPIKEGQQHQKTEEIVGPYELHDFFLWHMFVYNESPKKIFTAAKVAFETKYRSEEIVKWMEVFFRRFFAMQFKRSAMPDGPQVTPVSLSPRGGLTMPSDMASGEWLYEIGELLK